MDRSMRDESLGVYAMLATQLQWKRTMPELHWTDASVSVGMVRVKRSSTSSTES